MMQPKPREYKGKTFLSPSAFKRNVNAMRDFTSYEDYLWYMESLVKFLDTLEDSINLMKMDPIPASLDDIEETVMDLASKTNLPITLEDIEKLEVMR